MILKPRASLRSHRRSGFTLIELMVAIGLLSVLGLLLIGSLRTAVRIVATGTARGDALIAAQSIITRVEADLTQVLNKPGGRLVSGRDPYGRPFLALIRSLPEERSIIGGFWSGSNSTYEGVWNGVQHDGNFRPLGGVAEVVYLMDPMRNPIVDPNLLPITPSADGQPTAAPLAPFTLASNTGSRKLYRGVQAPVGGTPPAFRGAVGTYHTGLIEDLEWWIREHGSGNAETAGLALKTLRSFEAKHQVISDGVLYFGVAFYDGDRPGWLTTGPNNGPSWAWETNAVGTLRDALDVSWPCFRSADEMPRDRDIPRAAMISVTVAMAPPLARSTQLAVSVGDTEMSITVADVEGFDLVGDGPKFVKVNEEWMEYANIVGNTFMISRRGARGTVPANHEPGAPVVSGLTLSRIVSLPAGR